MSEFQQLSTHQLLLSVGLFQEMLHCDYIGWKLGYLN